MAYKMSKEISDRLLGYYPWQVTHRRHTVFRQVHTTTQCSYRHTPPHSVPTGTHHYIVFLQEHTSTTTQCSYGRTPPHSTCSYMCTPPHSVPTGAHHHTVFLQVHTTTQCSYGCTPPSRQLRPRDKDRAEEFQQRRNSVSSLPED